MRGQTCVLVLTIAGALSAQVNTADRLKAQHDREDQLWAQKSGLPVSEVQAIRGAAGLSDATEVARIVNLDAASLKMRNQILLVEGPCVKVHVMVRGPNGFTEVWSLTETPRPSWKIVEPANRPGRGICPQAPRSPSAHATPDGRIVVEVPILQDPFLRTLPVDVYLFTWDGATYKIVDDER